MTKTSEIFTIQSDEESEVLKIGGVAVYAPMFYGTFFGYEYCATVDPTMIDCGTVKYLRVSIEENILSASLTEQLNLDKTKDTVLEMIKADDQLEIGEVTPNPIVKESLSLLNKDLRKLDIEIDLIVKKYEKICDTEITPFYEEKSRLGAEFTDKFAKDSKGNVIKKDMIVEKKGIRYKVLQCRMQWLFGNPVGNIHMLIIPENGNPDIEEETSVILDHFSKFTIQS